ncbi:MAG: PTS sugar transporter subunit IIA, partial [Caldibacillus sp.]
EYVFLRKNFQTMEEVIRFLGSRLFEDGLVGEDYIDSVLQREKIAYTSYGNLMAIPHPVFPCTKETFWSIVTLKNPIVWGKRPVQFVLLLNIGETVKHDLKPMYDLLIKLLDNSNLIQRLVQCETYDEFMTVFEQWYEEL